MILGAHAIIYKNVDRGNNYKCLCLLLQKRTLTTNTYPGYWSLIGGTVEKNEEWLSCLLREESEEIGGLDIVHTDREDIFVPIYGFEGAKVAFAVWEMLSDMEGLRARGNECMGLALFTVEELQHIPICPEHRTALDIFIRSIK